jgi:hypothetical protein
LRSSFVRALCAAVLFALAAALACARPARAIPIFAQRYHLRCTACHTVLPELNAFGNAFREHGYRLPVRKHGTTVLAMRYQLQWSQTPPAGSRRWSPGGIVLGNADIGEISAFIHYSLGAGGGPGGMYLAYGALYNRHTDSEYRVGLFELPLAQSPGQRLDDLEQYGYYGERVGLNDLALSSPRWGIWDERTIGTLRADFTAAIAEYKGSAYGGKPVATGETTTAARPELGLFLDQPFSIGSAAGFDVGGEAMNGMRHIMPVGRTAFNDAYSRYGLLAHANFWDKIDLQAEQWWGDDRNADGFGTNQTSSGGYVRFKYYPIEHAYFGARYDAAANPVVTRDFTYYAAVMIEPVRLLLQEVSPIASPGNHPSLGGAMTIAFPGPLRY